VDLEPPNEDPRDRLGDPDGRGMALLNSAGDSPMKARQSFQDQPLLTREASGLPFSGSGANQESALTEARTMARPQSSAAESAVATAPEPARFGMPQDQGELARPNVSQAKQSQPPSPSPQEAQPQQPAPPAPPAAVVASAVSSRSAPPAPLGVPAPHGESDSDPVTTVGSADFHPGSTDVRLGRKFKLARPHFSLAGETDMYLLRISGVTLKLRIDETGKVTSATVFRSSGRDSVDQPCVVAAYNWWFEPLKDETGKPIKDVMLFTLRFF
jgi:TonB family protein